MTSLMYVRETGYILENGRTNWYLVHISEMILFNSLKHACLQSVFLPTTIKTIGV